MKKNVFTAMIVMIVALSANAQTSNGWMLVGGNLSNIGLNFQNGYTQFSVNLTPRAAWFIKDNLAVGGEVMAGVNTYKGYTSYTYAAGPIARYYVPSALKTRWFLDANADFKGINTMTSGLPTYNSIGLGFGFGPGFAYFINPQIALEAMAKYDLTIGLDKTSSSANNAVNIAFGFQIHLPNNKAK